MERWREAPENHANQELNHGMAWPGWAGHGAAWQGRARQGKGLLVAASSPSVTVGLAMQAGHGVAGNGRAWLGTARRGAARGCWWQRVGRNPNPVPLDQKERFMHLAFVISGTNPLIMQSDLLADPLSEGAKKLKTFSSKKSKTDEDHASIGEIEFTWSMYYDEVIGPYIPAQNVERALRDAAALRKAGKNVERAVSVFPDRIPLQYDGPRDLDALIADRRFHDRRSVVVNGKSRVMRERPRFSNWRLEFEVRIDKNIIKSRQEMESIVEEAGLYIGLGTFRKRFGRFTVESVK